MAKPIEAERILSDTRARLLAAAAAVDADVVRDAPSSMILCAFPRQSIDEARFEPQIALRTANLPLTKSRRRASAITLWLSLRQGKRERLKMQL